MRTSSSPSIRRCYRRSVLRHQVIAWLAIAVVALVLLPATAYATSMSCWQPPVVAPITDPFRAPACPWCAGNRGIEYGTAGGEPVRAAASGVVTFAGAVAGTRYVVIELANGWRLTYGRLRQASVSVGQVVTAGQRVGVAGVSFHFGLRDGDRYLDPTEHLGTWRYRPRLIPLDGTPARPVPAPTISCPNPGGGR